MTRSDEPEARIVVMTVAANGCARVTVDGTALLPVAGMWSRESFAAILDQATGHRHHSAVVEVREADGTVFTHRVPTARRRTSRPAGSSTEVTGVGFLPGEQVSVAVVTQHLIAEPDGSVHAWLPGAAACCPGGLVLVGLASGTLHIEVTA